MKRVVLLELEVADDDALRLAARAAAYGAWAVLGKDARPVVKIAVSANVTLAVRSAWEAAEATTEKAETDRPSPGDAGSVPHQKAEPRGITRVRLDQSTRVGEWGGD